LEFYFWNEKLDLVMKNIKDEYLINKGDKIFIAGHQGMVGSSLVRKFKNSGFNNILTEKKINLNLLNFYDVEKWFSKNKPDVVILAAARVGGIYANQSRPTDFLLENIKIQNNVIEMSWKYGVKKLLFLGSSCIYPKFAKQPIKEEYLMDGPLEKTNEWYAIAKISGIKLCQAFRKQFGFNTLSLMPTNLYGPGDNYHKQDSHVLPAMIMRFYEAIKNGEDKVKCWGSGLPKREFLHVDDLSDACLYVLKNWNPSRKDAPKDSDNNILELLNVGTGEEITIKDLAKLISDELGFKGEIIWDQNKPDGTPRKLLDSSRLKSLGWKSKIKLEEGIRQTIISFYNEVDDGQIRL